MTPEEIQKELEKLGLSIGRSTLTQYARRGVIGEPDVKALGRGRGKVSLYPKETPAEIVAARVLVGSTLKPAFFSTDFRIGGGGIGPKITIDAIAAVRRFAYNTKAGELSDALKREGDGDPGPLQELIGGDWNPIWFFDLLRNWVANRAWVLHKLPEPPQNVPYPTVKRLDALNPEQAVIDLYDP